MRRKKKNQEEEEDGKRRRMRTVSMYRIRMSFVMFHAHTNTKHVNDMLHKGKYGQLHIICIKKKTFNSPKMNLI